MRRSFDLLLQQRVELGLSGLDITSSAASSGQKQIVAELGLEIKMIKISLKGFGTIANGGQVKFYLPVDSI